MTKYLKEKLNKDKIGLIGHSFGAGFGALAASTYPDDYSIYIGIGQPSDITEQNRVTYLSTIETANDSTPFLFDLTTCQVFEFKLHLKID